METVHFSTSNAGLNYQGISVGGYAAWRIDPARPEVAIATLDFFDEDDPMRNTNEKLLTICVEAVRHTIANMSVEDALRKKDEIGESLRGQLLKFEERWGVLFDQVGIEQVRIMSSQLSLARAESDTVVRRVQLLKEQEVHEQQRTIVEGRFRTDAEFERERQATQYEKSLAEERLKIELQEAQTRVLQTELELQKLKTAIAESKLLPQKALREIQQTYTPEELTHQLVQKLPEVFGAIEIDNYSVMNTGDGDITPISRILQEVIGIVRGNNPEDLLRRNGNGGNSGSGGTTGGN